MSQYSASSFSIALLALASCSTGTGGGATDGGVDGGATDGGVDGASVDANLPPRTQGQPPARPSASASGGETRWFAVTKLKIGLTTPSGAVDPKAWKDYGYDLDYRTTTAEDSKTSLNSCHRRAGSGTTVLTDGNLGRDNNYGQHVMAVIKSLKSDAEDAVNQEIADGGWSLLLRLDNVGPDDNADVPGAIYGAAQKEGAAWTIDGASVDPAGEPKLKFPRGYMRGGVWVSGEVGTVNGPFPLVLGLGGVAPTYSESIVVSFRPSDGTAGMLAAAVSTAGMKVALEPFARRMGICPGNATYDQVVDTLTQSADLVLGAPQLQDTERECNAISLGMGFVAAPTAAPTKTTTPPGTGPDECSTDGGF